MSEQIIYRSNGGRWVYNPSLGLWSDEYFEVGSQQWRVSRYQVERPTILNGQNNNTFMMVLKIPNNQNRSNVSELISTPNMEIFKAGLRRYKSG